jgi:hypothetical protein
VIYAAKLQLRLWRPKDYASERQMKFQAGVGIVYAFNHIRRLMSPQKGGRPVAGEMWEEIAASIVRSGAIRSATGELLPTSEIEWGNEW